MKFFQGGRCNATLGGVCSIQLSYWDIFKIYAIFIARRNRTICRLGGVCSIQLSYWDWYSVFWVSCKGAMTRLLSRFLRKLQVRKGIKPCRGSTVKCSWRGCILQCWNKEKVAAIYLPRLFWWELVDSNHRSIKQQIYSLSPLATRESSHIQFVAAVSPGDVCYYSRGLFKMQAFFWFFLWFFEKSAFSSQHRAKTFLDIQLQ